MSDSSTHLNTISVSQSSKEVTANGLFDAMSPNALFGRHDTATSALTWGYYGGKYRKADGTILTVANGTVALTDAATNYLLETDGVVSKVTAAPAGWPAPLAAGANALYAVVCSGGAVTGYTDYRIPGLGGAISVVAADVGITDAGGYFTGTDVEAALQELGAAVGGAGTGDVVGPASAVADRVVFFDGTTGKLIKDSGLTLSGTNTGDQTSVSGNAGTATALQTARTIGGVSFDGTANITQPYDMVVCAPGVPTASQVLLKMTMPRAVTLAANLSGSKSTEAVVAATESTVVDINNNGTLVATLTFAIWGTVPTLATSGGTSVSFAADDILTVVCPASPDATLSGIYIVLAGAR
jgi:hypothetical protein